MNVVYIPDLLGINFTELCTYANETSHVTHERNKFSLLYDFKGHAEVISLINL